MNTFFSERLVALSKTHLVTRNRLFRKTEVRVNSFVTQFALFVLFNWPKVNTFFGVFVTKYLTNCNKVRLFFQTQSKKKKSSIFIITVRRLFVLTENLRGGIVFTDLLFFLKFLPKEGLTWVSIQFQFQPSIFLNFTLKLRPTEREKKKYLVNF